MTVQTELRSHASVRPNGNLDGVTLFIRTQVTELVPFSGDRYATDVVVWSDEVGVDVERVIFMEDGVLDACGDQLCTRDDDGGVLRTLLGVDGVLLLVLVGVVEDGLPGNEHEDGYHNDRDSADNSLAGGHDSPGVCKATVKLAFLRTICEKMPT